MISVCIATYNGEDYIFEQIHTVLTQLGPLDELIISDDGSSDKTFSIISEFNDSRIKFFHGGSRLGVVKNFERALSAACGETIFLCDQDDIWLPGKVERCMKALVTSRLVVTDCTVVNRQLETVSHSFFRLRHSGPGVLRNLWKNSYLGCCMAMRSSVLSDALPFPKDIPMHDWWIGLIAESDGGVCFIDEPLLLYRRHDTNASPATTVSSVSMFTQFRWRYDLVRHLIARRMRYLNAKN